MNLDFFLQTVSSSLGFDSKEIVLSAAAKCKKTMKMYNDL